MEVILGSQKDFLGKKIYSLVIKSRKSLWPVSLMKPITLLQIADGEDLPYITLNMWLPAVSPTFISWIPNRPILIPLLL